MPYTITRQRDSESGINMYSLKNNNIQRGNSSSFSTEYGHMQLRFIYNNTQAP